MFLDFHKKFRDHKVKKVWGFWVKKIIVYVVNLKNLGKQNNKTLKRLVHNEKKTQNE
jgi:hypothetical protein